MRAIQQTWLCAGAKSNAGLVDEFQRAGRAWGFAMRLRILGLAVLIPWRADVPGGVTVLRLSDVIRLFRTGRVGGLPYVPHHPALTAAIVHERKVVRSV